MNSIIIQREIAIQKLIRFINTCGPEENQYDELTQVWDSLNIDADDIASAVLTREKLIRLFGDDFMNQTIQGFGYRKPHGYAGDFEIIDYIYQKKINADERFRKWDKYLHSQAACKAVINRKTYFIELVKEKLLNNQSPLRILNIASGPCRDLLELFGQVSTDKIKIHCVEMDPNAICYARNLLGKFSASVEFIQENIFKFNTDDKFDLVWSAGLFDYFADGDFIKLLSKVYSWCSPSGEMVIGNFSVSNPSRSYMEKGTGWYLFHRTEDELKSLARKAGLRNENIKVRSEVLGINLFLHANS
jgi:extracellular factor (EF) 3-hydroxypalmitic acid methyl ester biosynthesis protein